MKCKDSIAADAKKKQKAGVGAVCPKSDKPGTTLKTLAKLAGIEHCLPKLLPTRSPVLGYPYLWLSSLYIGGVRYRTGGNIASEIVPCWHSKMTAQIVPGHSFEDRLD